MPRWELVVSREVLPLLGVDASRVVVTFTVGVPAVHIASPILLLPLLIPLCEASWC